MSANQPPHQAMLAEAALVVELAAHLQAEARHVAGFQQVLVGESRLLVSAHRPEALHRAVKDKEAAVAVLEQDEARRGELLARLGVPPAQATQASALDQLAQRHELLAGPWRELREQVQAAGELNRRNGAMLAVHRTHVEGALADIRQARSKTMLYDARGRARKLG